MFTDVFYSSAVNSIISFGLQSRILHNRSKVFMVMQMKITTENSTFIAPGAIVLGDVTLGEEASIWYHATVRGDKAPIVIGKRSNVQDNAVVHVDSRYPVIIGENVTIGHSAIVHGCEIGDNSLIGMGSIIMNGAKIGKNCLVGAGALVLQNTVVPDNSLVLGNPAKVKRQVTGEEIAGILHNAMEYAREAADLREKYNLA